MHNRLQCTPMFSPVGQAAPEPQSLQCARLLLPTEPEKEKDISFSVTASQRGAEPLRVANHLIYSWKKPGLLDVMRRNRCHTLHLPNPPGSLRGAAGAPAWKWQVVGLFSWGCIFQKRGAETLTLRPIGHEATDEPPSLQERKTATLFPSPGRNKGHYSLGN